MLMVDILTYKQFGKHLLTTEDLDPVYTMLHRAKLKPDLLARWCLAYWCFYHTGVASRIAETPSNKFHALMRKAQTAKWPRGAERRHFRGDASSKALTYLKKLGPPEAIVEHMTYGDSYSEVTYNVQKIPLFGPWIAFKIVDMCSQVLGRTNIDYSDCHLGIYKDPRQGAALIKHGDWTVEITDKDLVATVNKLIKEFKRYSAPPQHLRKVGIMEIETILCKYKSHYKGSYPLYKDSKEIYHMNEGWGDLAKELQQWVPNQDQL
jgi:hypothetical protein